MTKKQYINILLYHGKKVGLLAKLGQFQLYSDDIGEGRHSNYKFNKNAKYDFSHTQLPSSYMTWRRFKINLRYRGISFDELEMYNTPLMRALYD